LDSGVVCEGNVESEKYRIKLMWKIREGIKEGMINDGYV
jgi:hypothetical protein